MPLAAWGAVQDLDLPRVAPVPCPALRVFGVDATGEASLHSIYETFLRASPVNIVTAFLMGRMLDEVPEKNLPFGDDMPPWQPPAPPRSLPPFPPDNELGADIQRLLEPFEVDMDGATFAVAIGPLFKREDIVDICSQVVARIDAVVPPLAEGLSAGPMPFDSDSADALRGSLRVYRGLTSPQMIVFNAILQDALPETSSI